jgi:hypothetical protein
MHVLLSSTLCPDPPVRAQAAVAQAAQAARRARPRVFTLRISMRALLQLLVFGVVLYQVRSQVAAQGWV